MTALAPARVTTLTEHAAADFEPFMAFYDRTCDAAYRLACCVTGDPATAGDAVIRAYVRAYTDGRDTREGGLALILGLVREELAETIAELRNAHRPQREAS